MDKDVFQRSLLALFMERALALNFFVQHGDPLAQEWLETNLKAESIGMMDQLLQYKAYMLPHIIKAWESRVGRRELEYHLPTPQVNAVSRYFYWIRWANERIHELGSSVPKRVRPGGIAYPSFSLAFQRRMILKNHDPCHRILKVNYSNKTKSRIVVGNHRCFH